MSWLQVAERLENAARARGGNAFVYDDMVVLSSGTGQSIIVRNAEEDGVFIEAGWSIKIVENCEQYGGETCHALDVIEAIMDGHAEESAIVDDTGNWVDTAATIRHAGGVVGDVEDSRRRFIHRIPAWMGAA
jgi:hypothetical protein